MGLSVSSRRESKLAGVVGLDVGSDEGAVLIDGGLVGFAPLELESVSIASAIKDWHSISVAVSRHCPKTCGS